MRTSFSPAVLKSGSGVVSVILSAVLEKRRAVVIDGEVPMPHRELMQEDRPRLLVGQEEVLDGDLELARRLFAINGKVLDVGGDKPE